MTTPDKIIPIFCLIDDLFIQKKHRNNKKCNVTYNEIAITAIG